MIAWWLATFGHFLLTSIWLRRAETSKSRDEHWFQTMLVAIGSLSVALHLVSTTVGLTLWRALLVLSIGHAVAWYSRGPRKPPPSEPRTAFVTRALEVAATVAITAIVLQWILVAGQTAEVTGSDAAHYHLPNAVNLALGSSVFDLPPTAHLYPMGSSTLAAWFLLPVQTPLFSDLVMVLPFLLLVSSAGWLFRMVTSASGLAWSTWLMLALFATPLFRASSLMSADLLFAGATVAFIASVLSPLLQRRLIGADVWFIALSLGLLLGAKVTGIIAALLFGIPALLVLAFLKLRGRWSMDVSALVWAGAMVTVIGAGGIWLLRNWWVWGSPVAPNGVALFGVQLFPGSTYADTKTYLSVFGDMAAKPDYPLWERTHHFINTWLSSWYLPALAAMVLIPVDAFANRGRSVRLGVALVVCAATMVMAWVLIGAPWTSLEWTGGFSLRYALPWLALLPIVAWIALFPASFRWYQRPTVSAIAGAVVMSGALALLRNHQQPTFPPWPSPVVILIAVALIGAPFALQFVPTRWKWLLAIGMLGRAVILLADRTTTADTLAQETRAAAIASGPRTIGERIFDAAIAFEAKEGRSCDAEGRRFFITNRFDEAGTLQGPRLTNRVFYAARDVRVTAQVHAPMGPCDYLLTERAIMDTDKGAALHRGLNPAGALVEIGLIGDVVLMVHRAQTP